MHLSLPDIREMSASEMSPFHEITRYKSAFTYLQDTNPQDQEKNSKNLLWGGLKIRRKLKASHPCM